MPFVGAGIVGTLCSKPSFIRRHFACCCTASQANCTQLLTDISRCFKSNSLIQFFCKFALKAQLFPILCIHIFRSASDKTRIFQKVQSDATSERSVKEVSKQELGVTSATSSTIGLVKRHHISSFNFGKNC